MMIATSSNNHNIENSSATKNGKRRTLIMMEQQAVEAQSYNDRNEDDDVFIVAGQSIGLNHRDTNTTSSSLPSKTEMADHPLDKLNLYDLLYSGMHSNSKKTNTNTNTTMKSRLQNQPLSPKKNIKHHRHGMMTEGTTMMRRSVSHDPQGVRNASWGVVAHKAAASRVSYPSTNNHNMVSTARTFKKQSSSFDSATKLQQGVNEMLEMLQSTTFVGTIDPVFHGQYLKTEEKVDDDDENSMAMTDKEEKQAWILGSPSSTKKREQSRIMAPSMPPTSMVILVPNNVPSPSSSSVSLVSFTLQL